MTQPFEELLRTGRLPSPSGVGARILTLTQDPDATVDDIAEALARDPALTGRILGVANSALKAGTIPLTSAKDAAMRLGLKSVSSIAVGFTVVSENRKGHCQDFDYAAYWSISMASAVAAQGLARRIDPELAAEAFTAGLLLRIGRLGLASASPELYTGILHDWRGGVSKLRMLEQDALGIDHAELALRLVHHWGMPSHIAEALYGGLTSPLSVPEGPTRDLAAVLAASSRLASRHIGNPEADPEGDAELERLLAPLGMTTIEAKATLDGLEEEWRRLATDLEMRPLPPVDEEAPRGEGQPAVTEGSPLVLVVDDDAISLKILTNCLTRGGLRVAATQDPEEALALAVQHEPAVLITDWKMPKLDGLSLCRALRRCEVGRRLYVMVLTGAEEEGACAEAFDAEADDFIKKPINPREMLARVQAGVRLSEAQDQLARSADSSSPMPVAPASSPAPLEVSVPTPPPGDGIDDIAQADQALGEDSGRDMVTGLPNRVFATSRLAVLFERCAAVGTPLSVVAMGIDGLDSGLGSGLDSGLGGQSISPLWVSDALQRTAGIVTNCLRKDDLLCVAGGGRLLLLCPNADLLEAATVADRLRGAIEAADMHICEGGPKVTISAGVAESSEATPTPAMLLQLAESALEFGAMDGSNRVHPAA